MDKERQLSDLSLQLSRSAADGDWRAVSELDRRIAAMLRKLAKQPLTTSEAERLDELRRAHEIARGQCEREWAIVERRLTELRERKEGWMAYALNNDSDEGRE